MKKTNVKQMLKEFFFVYPGKKLRVREIERELKLSLPSVIRYCRELEKDGILAFEQIGKVGLYKASRSSGYLLEKKLFNIKRLYESGLIEHLRKELSNPAIVLFGSYAKGEDTEESDIDLYIETPAKKRISYGIYNHILKRDIQEFRHRSLREISNPNLANNIINGITLNNEIEVF